MKFTQVRITDKKLPGFFLMQIAIGLVILGVISTIGVSKLTQYLKYQQIQKTEAAKERIFYALAGYVLRKRRLPYPGDESGVENKDLVRGIVPYKTLKILEGSEVKDGYGNYFTYAVDPELTIKKGSLMGDGNLTGNKIVDINIDNFDNILGESFCSTKHKNLSISTADSNDKIFGAFVLISHGPEGRGAPMSNKPAIGEYEDQNSNGVNLHFISDPISTATGREFSHQVYFITRDNFMAQYGKQPCYVKN